MMKLSLSAAVLAAGLAMATIPVSAQPGSALPQLKSIVGSEASMVEKTHGWHRKCRKGLNGWHKHVKGVGRVQCTVAKNCYTNVFGFKVCDWF